MKVCIFVVIVAELNVRSSFGSRYSSVALLQLLLSRSNWVLYRVVIGFTKNSRSTNLLIC